MIEYLTTDDIRYAHEYPPKPRVIVGQDIDMFGRQIVGLYIGLQCKATDAVMRLKTALWKRKLLDGGAPCHLFG